MDRCDLCRQNENLHVIQPLNRRSTPLGFWYILCEAQNRTINESCTKRFHSFATKSGRSERAERPHRINRAGVPLFDFISRNHKHVRVDKDHQPMFVTARLVKRWRKRFSSDSRKNGKDLYNLSRNWLPGHRAVKRWQKRFFLFHKKSPCVLLYTL